MCGAVKLPDDRRIMTVTHRALGMRKAGRELGRYDFVVHSCSNPLCCNPDHLIIGTASDRNRVMYAAGRWRPGKKPIGPPKKQNRIYKWSDEEIRFLRRASLDDIEDQFGVDRLEASKMRHSCRSGYRWLKD
jgi:hypothetical protein